MNSVVRVVKQMASDSLMPLVAIVISLGLTYLVVSFFALLTFLAPENSIGKALDYQWFVPGWLIIAVFMIAGVVMWVNNANKRSKKKIFRVTP